ncbi:helix-turn-helix transcriptional regulator [Luteolibacter pohnpeiensis]|uniref:Helix-turn-helix transcriptional regulator n=1 Tax=Luteolibacter pohnpeiensis TaxID=454153 RepID=A0A934S4Z1_9BACT|nr:AraC family transcriptional regulator [Luteolibacter pohnpeiensis]MBK1882362.1 helix-turn-helix transcriptional regulator [Luteolibacter pohnpeiensis]
MNAQIANNRGPAKAAVPARVGETWWLETPGMRCGRISGKTVAGGWRWKNSSDGQVWLWLNRSGSGLLWGEKDRFILKPGMFAMTGGGKPADWSCMRFPGEHDVEVVAISREWLEQRLGSNPSFLHPQLGKWLLDGTGVAFCGLMGVWEKDLCELLQTTTDISQVEQHLLEWAGLRLLREQEMDPAPEVKPALQVAQKRDAVRRALDLLMRRLHLPLDLVALAKEVGVAPHHLSRRVSHETGKTLQRHLRRLRVERACQFFDSGTAKVAEVASMVGYQSLSHFAKAFREEMGNTPSVWLARMRRC